MGTNEMTVKQVKDFAKTCSCDACREIIKHDYYVTEAHKTGERQPALLIQMQHGPKRCQAAQNCLYIQKEGLDRDPHAWEHDPSIWLQIDDWVAWLKEIGVWHPDCHGGPFTRNEKYDAYVETYGPPQERHV
jgi:hypothetical protein